MRSPTDGHMYVVQYQALDGTILSTAYDIGRYMGGNWMVPSNWVGFSKWGMSYITAVCRIIAEIEVMEYGSLKTTKIEQYDFYKGDWVQVKHGGKWQFGLVCEDFNRVGSNDHILPNRVVVGLAQRTLTRSDMSGIEIHGPINPNPLGGT